MRRRRTWLWVVVSIAAIVATPLLVHRALYLEHAASYGGICGPHAPDIPAHPCDRATYLAEFGAGFAGVGLLLIEALATVLAAAVVVAAWAVRAGRGAGQRAPR